MVFLFVPTLVGVTMLATFVLAFTARALLAVFQSTVVGEDELIWTDEPMADWIGSSIHLAALLFLWLVPIGFLARWLGPVWLTDDPVLRFIILAVPGIWLLFPIGLLSSASSTSPWMFFNPVIPWRLLRILPSTILFYLLTGLLIVGVAALWYAAFVYESLPLLGTAAVVGAAGVMIYGRQLGRLGWLVQRLSGQKVKEMDEDEEDEEPKPTPKRRKRKQPVVQTPVEPEPEPEAAKGKSISPWGHEMEDLGSYGLAAAPEPSASDAPIETKEPIEHLYNLHDREQVNEEREEAKRPKKRRLRKTPLAEKVKGPPPSQAMYNGVYDFPWRGNALKVWVALALGGFLLGFGGLLLVWFYPSGGGAGGVM